MQEGVSMSVKLEELASQLGIEHGMLTIYRGVAFDKGLKTKEDLFSYVARRVTASQEKLERNKVSVNKRQRLLNWTQKGSLLLNMSSEQFDIFIEGLWK